MKSLEEMQWAGYERVVVEVPFVGVRLFVWF